MLHIAADSLLVLLGKHLMDHSRYCLNISSNKISFGRFEFIKFPSTFISEDLQDTCLSRDGLSVEFKTTFQYQMTEKWLLPAIMRYRNFETWSMIVKSAAKSAIFHSCADYNITDYQKERGMLQDKMTEKIRIKLEGQGDDVGNHTGVFAKLLSLQVKNLNLPERYSTSVAEKQTAKEDIALAVNQRKQEVTKAKTALLSSKEEARKIADTANNEASITLTQARLRAEEILYAFENEAETLVRVKDDLNLTVDGILSYLATSVLATASELRVSAQEPASFSQKAL
jgi:regulator of protease activity HflC (stomatin/prohibitin superfamily)